MRDAGARSREAYNKLAHDYDNSREGRFTRAFKDMICAHISLKSSDRVLDVACGPGTLLSELGGMKPITGYGVDIADEMIKVAARRYPALTFRVAGCESMPFDDGMMDVITVCAAYHHFPNPDLFAKEAERLLRPGGLLYIADVRWPAFLRVVANPFMPLLKSGDVKIYSPKEIVNTFTKRQFTSAAVRVSGHIQLIVLRRI